MQDKAFLVTGGAGFIGSNLVDLLVEKGHPVYILDDLSSGKMENLERALEEPCARFIEGDIRRPLDESLSSYSMGGGPEISTIFHLAARIDVTTSFENPQEDLEINYLGTLNVINYALRHGIKRIIFSSSAAVYGDTVDLPVHEDCGLQPLSPYGLNKMASENLLRMYRENQGLSSASLRFFNVYGPRQDPSNPYSGVISKFSDRAMSGEPLIIYGDGEQTRDFIYVGDVVETLYRAALSKSVGEFNLGTGSETSVNQLARTIMDIHGKELEMINMPGRKGEILRSVASVDEIRKVADIDRFTELRDGLKSTMKWIQERK